MGHYDSQCGINPDFRLRHDDRGVGGISDAVVATLKTLIGFIIIGIPYLVRGASAKFQKRQK